MKLGEENVDIAIKLWNLFNEQRWDDARKLLSDDFEGYWPQSREKMSADGFIDVNRNYPGKHEGKVQNRFHEYDNWDHRSNVITVAHVKSEMPDGKKMEFYATSVFEIEEERILSLSEYWAESYPAPDWRKQWVERY